MRFMMFVCTDSEADPKPGEAPDIETWVDDADSSGKRIMGDRLMPQNNAKTVRVRSGRRIVTDGPFAESKEAVVGFDILECADMDEAIEIAARHPTAYAGRLELRAFWPLDN